MGLSRSWEEGVRARVHLKSGTTNVPCRRPRRPLRVHGGGCPSWWRDGSTGVSKLANDMKTLSREAFFYLYPLVTMDISRH